MHHRPALHCFGSSLGRLGRVSEVDEMKNLTITLPDDVARWLRVKAAEDDRSASRWVAELIERTRRQQDAYDVAMQRYLAMQPRKIEWPEGRKPTREELYDRLGLR